MNRQLTGMIVLIAASGMLASMMGNEIAALNSWQYVTTPAFIGKMLMHIGAIVGAYVAGQIIPTADRLKGGQ